MAELGAFAKELVESMNRAALTPSENPQEEFSSATIAVVRLLQECPLLGPPCVKWLQQKKAELSMAQLKVLYSPEELQAMLEQVKSS